MLAVLRMSSKSNVDINVSKELGNAEVAAVEAILMYNLEF